MNIAIKTVEIGNTIFKSIVSKTVPNLKMWPFNKKRGRGAYEVEKKQICWLLVSVWHRITKTMPSGFIKIITSP